VYVPSLFIINQQSFSTVDNEGKTKNVSHSLLQQDSLALNLVTKRVFEKNIAKQIIVKINT
jgi:hypothetical protein